MLTSAFRALGDLFSSDFRSVLFKALGLSLALFIAVLIGVEVLLVSLTQFSWPWADWVLGVGTGIALLVAFFFLMSPVTAAFAGLFLDQIAEKVEIRHYPQDPRGTPLPTARAIGTASAVLPCGPGGQSGGAAGRAVRGRCHRAGGGERLSPQPRIL
jgi:CysZ protein